MRFLLVPDVLLDRSGFGILVYLRGNLKGMECGWNISVPVVPKVMKHHFGCVTLSTTFTVKPMPTSHPLRSPMYRWMHMGGHLVPALMKLTCLSMLKWRLFHLGPSLSASVPTSNQCIYRQPMPTHYPLRTEGNLRLKPDFFVWYTADIFVTGSTIKWWFWRNVSLL